MEQKKVVLSRECKFVVQGKADNGLDVHYVKEITHFTDGTSEPVLRTVKNFKRPFFITKKALRTHKQKKDYEDLKNVDRFEATQKELPDAIARALGTPWVKGGLKAICNSPYVYGVDTTAAALIKHKYITEYKDKGPVTGHSVAVFDVETDVLNGTGEIIMATMSYKKHVVTAVKRSFFNGFANPMESIQNEARRYLGKLIKDREIELDVVLVDTEIEVLRYVIGKAHKLKPDFMAVWNIEFDMKKIIDACVRANINIADLLSDPSIPMNDRYFVFNPGESSLTTASGVHKNYAPHHKWPVVNVPASFHWIDAMCAYKKVRNAKPEEKSYSLDNILKLNKIPEKLKFPEADGLTGLAQHVFMQRNHPAKYVVYNQYDCVGMELLDEATLDLSFSLPVLAGISGFDIFHSNPKKLVDALHVYALDNGKVMSSTGKVNGTEFDNRILGRKGWIVMLDPYMNEDSTGLNCISENALLTTNIRTATYDADLSAAYPTNQRVTNCSKNTTKKEIINIDISRELIPMCSINLSGGRTNAVTLGIDLFKLPSLDDLSNEYDRTTC